METPSLEKILVSQKRNVYATLSPVGGGLAFFGNCLSLVAAIIPGISYICAVVNGLFSLSALVTGFVGLTQVNRSHGVEKGKGLAITGIVLGVLGVIASCLIPLLSTAILAALGIGIGSNLLVPIQ
jgi:hypothetical protein